MAVCKSVRKWRQSSSGLQLQLLSETSWKEPAPMSRTWKKSIFYHPSERNYMSKYSMLFISEKNMKCLNSIPSYMSILCIFKTIKQFKKRGGRADIHVKVGANKLFTSLLSKWTKCKTTSESNYLLFVSGKKKLSVSCIKLLMKGVFKWTNCTLFSFQNKYNTKWRNNHFIPRGHPGH